MSWTSTDRRSCRAVQIRGQLWRRGRHRYPCPQRASVHRLGSAMLRLCSAALRSADSQRMRSRTCVGAVAPRAALSEAVMTPRRQTMLALSYPALVVLSLSRPTVFAAVGQARTRQRSDDGGAPSRRPVASFRDGAGRRRQSPSLSPTNRSWSPTAVVMLAYSGGEPRGHRPRSSICYQKHTRRGPGPGRKNKAHLRASNRKLLGPRVAPSGHQRLRVRQNPCTRPGRRGEAPGEQAGVKQRRDHRTPRARGDRRRFHNFAPSRFVIRT